MAVIEKTDAISRAVPLPGSRASAHALSAMPGLKGDGRRVLSHGFTLLRAKEQESKRRIILEDIAAATGLSTGTIRKFVAEEDSDITGASIGAVSIMAEFLGVPMDKLFTIEREQAK